ncbi:MAG: YraN family protein [Pseudomonadota bacterium]
MAAGLTAYRSGLAAEDAVWRHYARRGYALAARRWRSKAGEIDLITRKDGMVIFTEVKHARDFATAAARLGPRQLGRIVRSAEAYLADEPRALDTVARIDVALVDGSGRIEIIENATAA